MGGIRGREGRVRGINKRCMGWVNAGGKRGMRDVIKIVWVG